LNDINIKKMHLQAFMYRSWAQFHNDLTQLKLNPKYFRQCFKVQTSLSEVLKAKYIVNLCMDIYINCIC